MLRARTARRSAAILGLTIAAAAPLPAVALADSGSSAGDQQYVDPLSGQSGSGSGSSSGSSSSGASSGSSSGSSSSGSSSSGSGSSGSSDTSSGSGTTATPTASAAVGATTTGTAKTLPYTGYDGGLAAAIGGGLLAGGLVLRRRSTR